MAVGTVAVVAASLLVALPAAGPAYAAPAKAPVKAPAKPACPPDRPDEVSAAVAAKLCGGRVEVTGLRSETTQVWANADGTMTAEQHLAPVRFRQAGQWVPIDVTLAKQPDGSVAPKAHPGGLRLSGSASGDDEHDVVVMGTGDQQTAVGWRGRLPEPVLAGPTATYAEVLPGVDLVVTVHRTGYEQSFVAKDRAALARIGRLTLPMRTGALTAVPDAAGGLALRDKNGRQAARTHPAEMWDAVVAPNSLEHVRRAPVGMTVKTAGAGRASLELVPDAAFLARSDLQFPVTVDPPASIGAAFDTFVQTGYTSDQSGVDELKLGYADDGGTWTARSYLKFDTSGVWDQGVLNATLNLWEWHSWSCTAASWEARRSDPPSTGTRWTAQPGWYETLGTSSQTKGYSSSCNDGWVGIELTPGFQSAATNHWSNLSVVLKAVNETNHNGWKRFDSTEGTHDPYVTLTYNSPPSVPSDLAVAPCYTSCGSGAASSSLRPTLSAKLADVNAGDSLSAQFEVWNAGHSTLIAASGTRSGGPSGSTATWQVGTDLTNGTGYEWRVRASDGRNFSAWSSWTAITVDTVKPGVPFVSANLYLNDGQPHGGANVPGTFTFTPAGGTADLAAFVYQLDTDTAQTTVAATAALTVTATPPSDGHRSMTVWAKDRAGNLSNPNVYAFQVGSAALAQPLPGANIIKRTKLAVDSVVPQYTRAYFEYRRGPGGAVLPVPSANLTSATGGPITATASSPVDWTAIGGYAIWNATDTLGLVGGAVEVRAQLYTATGTTPAYATAWVRVTVDPNGDGSATTDVGPGSANLLTGDYSLSSTDADDLGLNVSRTASSRSASDGWLPMGERLTPNQQQVSTDTAGFIVPGTSGGARVTSLGQGETTPVAALEITPTLSTSNDTYIAVGGDNGGLRLGMQPGKTYRMTGWIYVPGSTGLVPGFTSRSLRIVGFTNVGGVYTEVASAKAGYTDAWQQLSVDLFVPSGATEAFFRLYNGMQGGSGKKVYWDHLSVTEIVAPFGPSWRGSASGGAADVDYTTIAFPEASLAQVNLIGGGWVTFSKNADGVTYTPEPGSEGLILSKVDASTFRLTELDGTVSEFVQQGAVFAVTSTWTPESNTTARYVYDTTDNRVLLKKVINPVEPGVDDANHCTTATPARGCEVLEYIYATATTPGLSQTVFGDVTDHLSGVRLWTWDPVGAAETAVETAHYAYDNQGRLREVWDPRISPVLKTAYDYDGGGRVTKVTVPGQLPHMFDYGAPDADPGALIRWDFDEGSGATVADASGHGRAGTLSGGAGWGQANDPAYGSDRATAMSMSTGQQVAASGSVVNTTQSFTVSAWVNLTNDTANRTAVSQDGNRTSGFFLNYVQALNRWSFSQVTGDNDSATAVRATSTNPPVLGQWTHLTGVYDATAGEMRLYVNGVLQSAVSRPANWSATGAFVVGRAKWAGAATNLWSGGIDDVRAYQKVLTPDQVATLAGDENPGRLLRVRRAALMEGSKTVTDGEVATNLVYHVPLSQSAGGPYNLGAVTIGSWGQQDLPTDATAVFGTEGVPSVNSATATAPGPNGYPYADVHYLNAGGLEVNTAAPGGHIDTTEYDKFGNVVRDLQASDRELALGTLPNAGEHLASLGLSSMDTAARAMALSTLNTYSSDGTDLLDVLGPTVSMVLEHDLADPGGARPTLTAGSIVIGRAHTVNVYDEGKPDGATYHLVTTTTTGGRVTGYPDADTRVTKNGYGAEKGGTSGWSLKKATSVNVDAVAGGANLTSFTVYDSAGRTTESWTVGANGSDARTTRSIFYTAGANAADSACGGKPEWAGELCVSLAAGQITGQRADMSSALPVKRIESYSRYGTVAQVLETADGHTRRTTRTFDDADRVRTAGVVSDVGTAVPIVTTNYDASNGQVASTTFGGATLTREQDLLGRQVTYSDADGGTTRYTFDRHDRPIRVEDNTAVTTLTYDLSIEPRGFLTSLTDSVAGTFTAGYSPDGQVIQVGYPGGLTRRDVLDASFNPRQRSYTRDSDGTVVFAESVVENTQSQRVQHTYTGGSKTYAYDRLGRLTSVSQVDAAATCTTREYTYDQRTNRSAKNVYAPAADGSCRTGTPDGTENHTYDSADRLTDTGYVYDAFGRVTAQPDGLQNTYFVNDLVASQQLGDTRQSWTAYPDQRLRAATREVLASGSWTSAPPIVNHYGDDTDRPRWITDSGTGEVSRNVSGVDGELAAVTSATGDVSLKLTDLHGDVVVSIDTALTTPEIYSYDEFGVAAPGTAAPRYGWLGGALRSAEALDGVILMGVRLYAPSLGRFLQVDPQPGGSANAYDYCAGDPVNCSDLDGRWPNWVKKVGNGVKAAASWTYNHASDIGTVVGTVSLFLPPPANVIGGAIAIGFSAVGAYRDARQGNWGNFALGVAGAIPGVGAFAKGVRAYKAGKTFLGASRAIGRYAPRAGSKAWKMKNLVRPMRKARSAAARANRALRPWERTANAFGAFDAGRMGCKYWSSCRKRVPYSKHWL
ncbi:LamG-like jellyroll fold domain-containing protein [Dactylosporangium sp. CA-092794]|uniref:LamG-like jellyroll fold domain-containing protein n=1 Tax=Dactylosporangium sp. CA-092794 TaxID=3239929 RepID=UPI003D92AC79